MFVFSHRYSEEKNVCFHGQQYLKCIFIGNFSESIIWCTLQWGKQNGLVFSVDQLTWILHELIEFAFTSNEMIVRYEWIFCVVRCLELKSEKPAYFYMYISTADISRRFCFFWIWARMSKWPAHDKGLENSLLVLWKVELLGCLWDHTNREKNNHWIMMTFGVFDFLLCEPALNWQ